MAASKGSATPELFWTLKGDLSSDFTAEDPLALDYIAQQIGNWLLPGLTSRTTRSFYYPMVLYGLDLAEEAIDTFGLLRRDNVIQDLFERWERLWAFGVARYHGGKVPAEDRMRGVRGAERASRQYNGDWIPLDYRLIGRQVELAAFGAYMSSLRYYEFVQEGSLTPTVLGRDLAGDFWDDGGHWFENNYRKYVLEALDPDRSRIRARKGMLRIEHLGELGRLGRIRERKELQTKIWQNLFQYPLRKGRPDYTPEIASLVIKAGKKTVTKPREVILWILKQKNLPAEDLANLLQVAMLFEDFASWARMTFDLLHRAVSQSGTVIQKNMLASQVLKKSWCRQGSASASLFFEHPFSGRVKTLPAHGSNFHEFAFECSTGGPNAILESMLRYHRCVQVSRYHSDGWLRELDQDTVVCVPGYSARYADWSGWTHTFKIDALRMLLTDLGKTS